MVSPISYMSSVSFYDGDDDAGSPSGAAYAARYSTSRRGSSAQQDQIDPVAAQRRYGDDVLEQLDRDRHIAGPFAHFHDVIPDQLDDLRLAIEEEDFERARAIDGDIKAWAKDNRGMLRTVMDWGAGLQVPTQNVSRNGVQRVQSASSDPMQQLAVMSQQATSLLDGTYLDEGMRRALRQDSPEYRAQRVNNLVNEIGVTPEVASAMLFKDDPMHVVYGVYGQAFNARVPSDADAQTALTIQRAKRASRINLDEVYPVIEELKGDYRETFGERGTHELGRIVSGYERLFNSKNGVGGRSLLHAIATGYLAQTGGMSPEDYLGSVYDINQQIFNSLRGADVTPGSKGFETDERMVSAEARSFTAALLRQVVALGEEHLPLDGTSGRLYAASVSDAAKKVHQFSKDYGTALRHGMSGMSDQVVKYALRNAGVEGVDDNGLGELIEGLPSLVGRIGSPVPEGMPATPAGMSRQREQVPSDAQPALEQASAAVTVENAVRRAVGTELLKIRKELGGSPSLPVLVGAVQRNPDLDARLKNAATKALSVYLGNGVLASSVAEDMYKSVYGGVGRTFTESIVGRSGMYDPKTGQATVPQQRLFDLDPDMTQRDLALIDSDVDSVLPALKGNVAAKQALAVYSRAAKVVSGGGRDAKKNSHHMAAAGVRLAEALVPAGGTFLTDKERGLLEMVVRDDAPFSKKVAIENDFKNIMDLAQDAKSGKVDALLTLAMLQDRYDIQAKVQPFSYFSPDVGAAGAVTTHYSEIHESQVKRARLIQDALVSAGIRDPKGRSCTSQLVGILGAQGRTSQSVLLKNGFITPEGKFSVKNAVRTMQAEQYADPIYRYGASRKDPGVPVEQLEAQRALGYIFPGNRTVDELSSVYRTALMQEQGYTAEEASLAMMDYKDQMATALRNGGVPRMLKADAAYRSRRVYYAPHVNQNGSITKLRADPVNDGHRMTREEYDQWFREQNRLYLQKFGRSLDYTDWLAFSGAQGHARYRKAVELAQTQALGRARSYGSKSGALAAASGAESPD